MLTIQYFIKKAILLLLGIISVSCSLQCCSNDDHDYPMDNQQFVTQASSSNNFEIAAGALAQSKGVRPEVKNYGQHMVMDHSSVGAEMINLAASKGWTIPTSLQAKEQANLDKLNASTSATFDKDFATIMVASHNDAIAQFNIAGGSEGVRDGQLRAFAVSKLSALNSHLAEATALLTTVNQP
jgi:putative membrane protein